MTINSITQLATSAKVSSVDVFKGESINTSTQLEDLELENQLLFDEDDNISFSINGKEFTSPRRYAVRNDEHHQQLRRWRQNDLQQPDQRLYHHSQGDGQLQPRGDPEHIGQRLCRGERRVRHRRHARTRVQSGRHTTIEGRDVVRSSNTFTIDGITYTLNDESSAPISFNVLRDVESTVNKITAFIDAYNSSSPRCRTR